MIIYGYPVLLTAKQTVWNRLQIIQNKAIRAALGRPTYTSLDYVHKISSVPRIKDYVISLLHKSIQRAATNNDTTLKKHLQAILDQTWKIEPPACLYNISIEKQEHCGINWIHAKIAISGIAHEEFAFSYIARIASIGLLIHVLVFSYFFVSFVHFHTIHENEAIHLLIRFMYLAISLLLVSIFICNMKRSLFMYLLVFHHQALSFLSFVIIYNM